MRKFILILSVVALLLALAIMNPGCERKESEQPVPEATTPRDGGTNGAIEQEALPGMEQEQQEETQKFPKAEPEAEEEREQRNGGTPSQRPGQQSPDY